MTGELARRPGRADLPALAEAAVDVYTAIQQIGTRLLLAAEEGWYLIADVLPVVLKYRGVQLMRDFVAELPFVSESVRDRIRTWLQEHGW